MVTKIFRRPAGAECASILADLPEWFGIPDSNAAYADHARRESAWVAERDDEPIGIMILVDHGFSAVEIELLAVRRADHRHGVGRTLVQHALNEARVLGKPYLTVKTRGPSLPYEPYDRTRAFYEAVGFMALEETTAIWGPENPCLMMVRPAAA
jgi:GNAT superfamily N-acetyltransferase